MVVEINLLDNRVVEIKLLDNRVVEKISLITEWWR